jgi:hypothetical protein
LVTGEDVEEGEDELIGMGGSEIIELLFRGVADGFVMGLEDAGDEGCCVFAVVHL